MNDKIAIQESIVIIENLLDIIDTYRVATYTTSNNTQRYAKVARSQIEQARAWIATQPTDDEDYE